MIPGRATPEGTTAYAKRHTAVHPAFWRESLGLTLSSLGIGTYLGNADARTDESYTQAALKALELGINVIDSAINYRFQRSERSIGVALKKAVEGGQLRREEVLICTKGGFLSGDGQMPTAHWLTETFVTPGVATFRDIVADCHCMTPKYLKHQVEQSRRNLGVETIDVYYVHNPETQIPIVGEDEFYRRLTEAFRALEECVAEKTIQFYGTATWDAYRVPEGDASYLSLNRVVECAMTAGGRAHHFKVIQLPFNSGMSEAYTNGTQTWKETPVTALEAAQMVGLTVFTSVPLLQGRLLGRFSRDKAAKFSELTTDAQRCLQFVRSTPGISAPLCGMKTVGHVEENSAISKISPLSEEDFRSLFVKR